MRCANEHAGEHNFYRFKNGATKLTMFSMFCGWNVILCTTNFPNIIIINFQIIFGNWPNSNVLYFVIVFGNFNKHSKFIQFRSVCDFIVVTNRETQEYKKFTAHFRPEKKKRNALTRTYIRTHIYQVSLGSWASRGSVRSNIYIICWIIGMV